MEARGLTTTLLTIACFITNLITGVWFIADGVKMIMKMKKNVDRVLMFKGACEIIYGILCLGLDFYIGFKFFIKL